MVSSSVGSGAVEHWLSRLALILCAKKGFSARDFESWWLFRILLFELSLIEDVLRLEWEFAVNSSDDGWFWSSWRTRALNELEIARWRCKIVWTTFLSKSLSASSDKSEAKRWRSSAKIRKNSGGSHLRIDDGPQISNSGNFVNSSLRNLMMNFWRSSGKESLGDSWRGYAKDGMSPDRRFESSEGEDNGW